MTMAGTVELNTAVEQMADELGLPWVDVYQLSVIVQQHNNLKSFIKFQLKF